MAAYAPKKNLGSTNGWPDTLPVCETSSPATEPVDIAVPPVKVVFTVVSPPSTMASTIRYSGVQSGLYRTSARRVTLLTGADKRPVLVMVRPEAPG